MQRCATQFNVWRVFRFTADLILISLALVALAHSFRLIFENINNLPRDDDFNSVIDLLTRLNASQSFDQVLSILFGPHNEHRVLALRLIVISYCALFGQVNFMMLTCIGLLLLVCFQYFVAVKFLCNLRERIYAYLLLLLFVLNTKNYDNHLWATAALTGIPSLFCAFLSFYLITFCNRWVSALWPAILAAMTLANGFIVFFICCLEFFLQRRWRILALWLIPTTFFTYLQYLALQSLSRKQELDLSVFLSKYDYFLGFIGNGFASESLQFGVLFGIVIILLGIFSAFSRQRAAFLFFCFLVGTAALNLLARGNYDSQAVVIQSRYALPSFAVGGVLILNLIRQAKISNLLLPATLLLALSCYWSHYDLWRHGYDYSQQRASDSLTRYALSEEGLNYPFKGVAEQIIAESRNKYFDLSTAKPEISLANPVSLSEKKTRYGKTGVCAHLIATPRHLIINGTFYPPDVSRMRNNYFVILKSADSQLAFTTQSRINFANRLTSSNPNLLNTGYFAVIDRNQVPTGQYKVEILMKNRKFRRKFDCQRTLTL